MKKHFMKCTLSALILSLLPVHIMYGATYYVDATGGNDAKSGTSDLNAWKTIAKVNSSSFEPGDRILFKRGEIWREKLVVPSSGTAGNRIVFGAYGTGKNPEIRRTELVSSWVAELNTATMKVWRGAPVARNSRELIYNGKRMPQYLGYATSSAKYGAPSGPSKMKNGWAWFPLNSGKCYCRNDAGKPENAEIGMRINGIYIANRSYVTIQNIDVYGPGGTTREQERKMGGEFSQEQLVSIFITSNSHHITIKDLELSGCA